MEHPPGELTITGTAQREAWLRRVMPPVEQLEADLWSLPVPIPGNPLRYVSVYAFGTGEGLVLIDAGWGAEESWRALRAGLESIGAAMADVRGLPGRVDAIVAHHERRLAELLAAIRQRPGSTPWQLAGHLTWSRPWDQYGGQMRIFAVTETAAHARLLERRGLVTASRTRPPAYTARTA